MWKVAKAVRTAMTGRCFSEHHWYNARQLPPVVETQQTWSKICGPHFIARGGLKNQVATIVLQEWHCKWLKKTLYIDVSALPWWTLFNLSTNVLLELIMNWFRAQLMARKKHFFCPFLEQKGRLGLLHCCAENMCVELMPLFRYMYLQHCCPGSFCLILNFKWLLFRRCGEGLLGMSNFTENIWCR